MFVADIDQVFQGQGAFVVRPVENRTEGETFAFRAAPLAVTLSKRLRIVVGRTESVGRSCPVSVHDPSDVCTARLSNRATALLVPTPT